MYEEPHCKLAISVLVQFRGFAHVYCLAIAELTLAILEPKEVGIAVSKKVMISASVMRVAA
jgi:hypothetical protein